VKYAQNVGFKDGDSYFTDPTAPPDPNQPQAPPAPPPADPQMEKVKADAANDAKKAEGDHMLEKYRIDKEASLKFSIAQEQIKADIIKALIAAKGGIQEQHIASQADVLMRAAEAAFAPEPTQANEPLAQA